MKLQASEIQNHLAGLDDLEGWGKLKKKLGLNKLHTRDAIKAVNKAVVAVVAPTKSNLKSAEVAVKPYVAPVLAVASVALPVVGSIASAGWQAQRAKSAKKHIKKEAAQVAIMERQWAEEDQKAAAAEQAQQAADIQAQQAAAIMRSMTQSSGGGGGGGGAISYNPAPTENNSTGAPGTPPGTPEKTNLMAWAAGGLLAIKALSLVI